MLGAAHGPVNLGLPGKPLPHFLGLAGTQVTTHPQSLVSSASHAPTHPFLLVGVTLHLFLFPLQSDDGHELAHSPVGLGLPHLLMLKLVKLDISTRSLLRNKLVFEQWLAELAHRLQIWPLLRLLLALRSLRPGASSWQIVLVLGQLDGSGFFHPR